MTLTWQTRLLELASILLRLYSTTICIMAGSFSQASSGWRDYHSHRIRSLSPPDAPDSLSWHNSPSAAPVVPGFPDAYARKPAHRSPPVGRRSLLSATPPSC